MKEFTTIGLTIDWDYFADSDKFDFGHRENRFFIETVWNLRLQGTPELLKAFRLNGKQVHFWRKLSEMGLIPLKSWLSESHLHAYPLFMALPPDILINFDSHHDIYEISDRTVITCENWGLELLRRRKKMEFIWVHPEWNNELKIPGDIEDRVMSIAFPELKAVLPGNFITTACLICRSGAWMPPWFDKSFESFVKRSGIEVASEFSFHGEEDGPIMRSYKKPSEEEVQKYEERVEAIKQVERS